MRMSINKLLKEELRVLAIKTRDKLNLKQKEMAEELMMSDASYSDIETGTYMCGTLSAILLLMKQQDPNEFLKHFEKEIQKLYEKEKQTV